MPLFVIIYEHVDVIIIPWSKRHNEIQRLIDDIYERDPILSLTGRLLAELASRPTIEKWLSTGVIAGDLVYGRFLLVSKFSVYNAEVSDIWDV